MPWELAQVNVARLAAPLTDPLLADFVAALDPVNAVADHAPGFVWRLCMQFRCSEAWRESGVQRR